MARMVTQLLILARADTGAKLQVRPVPLGDLLAETCAQGSRMADGVRLVPAPVGILEDVIVQGDRDHLKQALLVLLDNAFKYTPRGGEVRVEAEVDRENARIAVCDMGPGIDPQDQPHVFERFYRGRTGAGATGTGLGLAIARWVVDEHGGTLGVRSEPGTGSRFVLSLPVS
jgi:two-component system OmpR family sensor kinase